jgi:CRP/FNR family transcriptional regulator, cyclic AMP receptor protein
MDPLLSTEKEADEPIPTGGQAAANPLWSNIFVTGASRKDVDAATSMLLKRIPVFEELTRRELAAVTRILYERSFQADELIFHQDDPGLGMYIIVQGRIAIVREPSRQLLAELHDGDFFGEMALLDELPRSATAIARGPCRVLGFFQPELFGLIERRPQLGVKIVMRLARIIGQRLRAMDERIHEVEKSQGP